MSLSLLSLRLFTMLTMLPAKRETCMLAKCYQGGCGSDSDGSDSGGDGDGDGDGDKVICDY